MGYFFKPEYKGSIWLEAGRQIFSAEGPEICIFWFFMKNFPKNSFVIILPGNGAWNVLD